MVGPHDVGEFPPHVRKAGVVGHPVCKEFGEDLIDVIARLLLFRKRQSQFRVYFTVESQRVVILSVRRSSRQPLEVDDLPG